MGTSDTDLIQWLLDQLDIDREWAEHAMACDKCWIDFGYEYGGPFRCRDYEFDHHLVTFGCKTRREAEWDERFRALWQPTIDAALRAEPLTFGQPPVGGVVEYRLMRDE